MGALMLALLFGGIALAAAAERKKGKGGAAPSLPATSPGQPQLPTDEDAQGPEQAGAEAIDVAAEAAAAAVKAAKEAMQELLKGNTQAAQDKANEATANAETGARAADAAAPTPAAQEAADLAKRAADAAIKAAEKAGVQVPDSIKGAANGGTPTSDVKADDVIVKSPGQPPVIVEDDEDLATKVVNVAKDAVKVAEDALEPKKAKPVPDVSPETSLPAQETKPENDPFGTIALARMLLERETAPSWREALKEAVGDWQVKLGLKRDGKFGPKSALRMADEVGIVPLVRFWPAGSQKASALADYRSQLRAKASQLEKSGPDGAAHAAALRQSAAAEDARAYGNPNAAPFPSAARAAVGA